jgi:hypothetical protein
MGSVFCQTRAHPIYEVRAAHFFLTLDDQWHDYRVPLFELGEITRVRLDPGEGEGRVEIERVSLVPSAVRALPQAPLADRVVYFDLRYSSAWGRALARLAEQLERKGFALVDADQLAAWMQARALAGAPGSVCVMALDTLPDTVFDSPRPECLPRRYLEAGGRIVWGGQLLFLERGFPDGDRRWVDATGGPRRAMPVTRTDVPEAAALTDEGRAFGLSRLAPTGYQVAAVNEVTTVLARVGRFYAASWLKTFDPRFPGSGLLRLRSDHLDGTSDAEIEELARVALHGLPASS